MTEGFRLSSGVAKYVLTSVLLLMALAGMKSYSITFLTRSIYNDRSSIRTSQGITSHAKQLTGGFGVLLNSDGK